MHSALGPLFRRFSARSRLRARRPAPFSSGTKKKKEEEPVGISVPSFWWGRWIEIGPDRTEWYFSSQGAKKNGQSIDVSSAGGDQVALADGTSFTRLSDNLASAGESRWCARAASASASISGRLADQDGSSKSFRSARGISIDGFGGIDLVLANIENDQNILNAVSDDSGSFTAPEGAIPGDSYALSFPGGEFGDIKVTLTIPESGMDAGIITQTDRPYNFKVSYSVGNGNDRSADASADPSAEDFLYPNGGWIDFTITNVGTAASPPGTWEFETAGEGTGFHYYGNLDLPALQSGESWSPENAIAVSCDPFTGDSIDRKIVFRIHTENNQYEWQDYTSLRFHNRSMRIALYSLGDPLYASVTRPGENIGYHVETKELAEKPGYYRGFLNLPWDGSEKYLVALVNASGENRVDWAFLADSNGDLFELLDAVNGAEETGDSANGSEEGALPFKSGIPLSGSLAPGALDMLIQDTSTVPVLSSPSLNPPGGDASSPLEFSFVPKLHIAAADAEFRSGARARYTMNGSTPLASSAEWDLYAPPSLASGQAPSGADTLVRAKVFLEGWAPSAEASGVYRVALRERESPGSPGFGQWEDFLTGEKPVCGHSLAAMRVSGADYELAYIVQTGGGTSTGSSSTRVSYLSQNSGMNLTQWENAEALPQARTRHASAIAGPKDAAHIFVLGGYCEGATPNYRSEVYTAALVNDRAPAGWKPTASLPYAAENLKAATAGNRIYVAGGSNGSSDTGVDLQINLNYPLHEQFRYFSRKNTPFSSRAFIGHGRTIFITQNNSVAAIRT